MDGVHVGQVWEQVSKHERGMQLEVVRGTGHRWVLQEAGACGRVSGLTEQEQRSVCTYTRDGRVTDIPTRPGPGITAQDAGIFDNRA